MIGYFALGHDQGAATLALVDDACYPRPADQCAARRQRPVEDQALLAMLAMHDLDRVDPRIEVSDPQAGMREHDGEGRQALQVLLEDEVELAAIHRI
ncbi:MAG TPA: hypothetical protein VFE63_21280 [Roseiarcus sp.]|nr:hypothetical protein [Roseiarcus sp.]